MGMRGVHWIIGVVIPETPTFPRGRLSDQYSNGRPSSILADVMETLTPGKFALVAEITESWTIPLDSRMEALGGTVFRTWRIDVEDEQIERDIQANRREHQELKEEWNQAVGDAKEKLIAKIQATEAKLQALDDRIEKKAETMMKESDAKVEKLNQQIAKAEGEFKNKLEKARDEVKADFSRRSEKLKQAGRLAAEALK
jgi:DNA anti-recombination protein RmuC